MFSFREYLNLTFYGFLLGLAALVLSWLGIEEQLELIKVSAYLVVLMHFSRFPPTFIEIPIALAIVPSALYFSITRTGMVGSVPFIVILLVCGFTANRVTFAIKKRQSNATLP